MGIVQAIKGTQHPIILVNGAECHFFTSYRFSPAVVCSASGWFIMILKHANTSVSWQHPVQNGPPYPPTDFKTI